MTPENIGMAFKPEDFWKKNIYQKVNLVMSHQQSSEMDPQNLPFNVEISSF